MKYRKINGDQYVDVVPSIAESFEEITNGVIKDFTFNMPEIDSALLTECVSLHMVFDNIDQVRTVLMNDVKLHVAMQVVGKISVKMFNHATLIIDYPKKIQLLLSGSQPAFHVVTTTINDAEKYILIDKSTWDNYWNNNVSGDDITDLDDNPFGDDDDGEGYEGVGDEPTVDPDDLPF